MKKIIFIIICFFAIKNLVNASTLISEEIPYYVLIIDNNKETLLQMKKIYDKDTSNVVFSVDYNDYEINDTFRVYDEYNNNWKKSKYLINHFQTIVHYGYNTYQNNTYYYLTQLLIWQTFSNKKIIMVDKYGNEITTYRSAYNKLNNNYNNHISLPSFTSKTYNIDLWDTLNLNYNKGSIILDNPVNGNLDIKNDNLKLCITGNKVSENKLLFSKYYRNEVYCYSDGENVYWQSLEGPANKEVSVNINVNGVPIKVKENIIGINNKYGDVLLDGSYELYLNNDLKLTVKADKNFYVKSNEKYILKDISNSIGVINSEDVNFEVLDEEIILNVDKYVISKNISFNILDNKTYYIYLKSNNELYEVVDNSTNLITLPYGIYYITDKIDFYDEIIVENTKDELIVINNSIEETEIESNDKNFDNIIIEEIPENIIENPKTLDNIYYYLILFVLSFILIYFNEKYVK